MKRSQFARGLLSTTFAAAAIAAALGSPEAGAQDFRMRLSHPLATSDQSHVALSSFAESMKKRSNGKVDITIFPADQMGRQKDVGEMIRQGANVIQMTDALFLGEWVPDAAILQAPYLLDKPEDFRKILGSDWLEDLNRQLAVEVLEPVRAKDLAEILGLVEQVGRLEDRRVGDPFAEEQRVGHLDHVGALADHLADVLLPPHLVGREDRDVDLAVGALLHRLGEGGKRDMRLVARRERMRQAHPEVLRPCLGRPERRRDRGGGEGRGKQAPGELAALHVFPLGVYRRDTMPGGH